MLDILLKIKAHKALEVDLLKDQIPVETLKNFLSYDKPCNSLAQKLSVANEPQIIAEFKRKSPSKGIISNNADPVRIASAYEESGAVAISVLTDVSFFGAHKDDFNLVRSTVDVPILRKDFIIDEYQVYETKAMGADILLLIAAILSPAEIAKLSKLARSVGLEVLLELHDEREVDSICDSVSMIGVNNRNLRSFQVDTHQSELLVKKLPKGIPLIAESGLSDVQEILNLYNSGFSGFLIGETFMKTDNPGKTCSELISRCRL